MQYFSAPVNPQTRRNIALECNRHLFEDAHQLSREAFELLEKAELDAELFTHYQALRQKADTKFEEAIEHLRLIEEELPSMENVALLQSKSAGQGFDSRV
jgi:exonuclease VII small subunit